MRHTLRLARIRKGLSVSEMARRLGISVSHYYKIEEGVRNPSMDLAKQIAVVLDTTVDALFFAPRLDDASTDRPAACQ